MAVCLWVPGIRSLATAAKSAPISSRLIIRPERR
jgi:hypothetical protein